MAVTVRLFAAVRDAAGEGEIAAEPAALAVLLADLRARFGEPFASRLGVCTVLIDGDATPQDAAVAIPDGAEVVILPPVSGGQATPRSARTA